MNQIKVEINFDSSIELCSVKLISKLGQTMKFRSDDTVTINFSNDDQINIKIGPVVNRVDCCFSFYKIVLSDDDTKRCEKMYNDDATFNYKDFKKKFKINHVAMIESESLPMTNQDMLNDLDFIKDEITNCKI